jgi:hypothetical protein
VRHDGNRVLSIDAEGHWALWNATTAALIASGNIPCQTTTDCGSRVELAGGVAAVGTGTWAEAHSATDGQILFTVAVPLSWWELAADGSYITSANTQALTAQSPTGAVLFPSRCVCSCR